MIVLLGDTHFGARGGNRAHHEHFALFYKDFFNYIDENKVDTIIQMGDLFDVRKHVNTWVLDFFNQSFLSEVLKRNLKVYVIVGNHDVYYRESISVNTPGLILKEYSKNFIVVDKPTEVTLEKKKFLLVPWIAKENKEEITSAITKSKADYLCGHFEFNGFPMHKGSNAKTSHTHDAYGKFKQVFSGHFHTRSSKDNVIYTGTPYEITWVDANDQKGFYTINDSEIGFVPNLHKMHVYVNYPEIVDVSAKFVRGVISDITDKKAIEEWKTNLESMGAHDIKYQEKTESTYQSSVTMDRIKSTEELIFEYVGEMETQLDKEKLKNMMSGLYQEAMGDKDD